MAHAQSERAGKKREDDKKHREYLNIRSTVFDKLAAIEKAIIEENDKEKVLKLVNGMLRRGKKNLSGHELAQAHKMAAWVSWELGDIPKTIEHYQSVMVDRDVIPETIEQSALYNLAQLYLQQDSFEEAIEAVVEWLSLIESPNFHSFYFLATVYSRMNDWERTASYGEIAIQLKQQAGMEVSKPWWNLLLLAYLQQGKLHDAARVLETLVRKYPSEHHWERLVDMYYQVGDTLRHVGALKAARARMRPSDNDWHRFFLEWANYLSWTRYSINVAMNAIVTMALRDIMPALIRDDKIRLQEKFFEAKTEFARFLEEQEAMTRTRERKAFPFSEKTPPELEKPKFTADSGGEIAVFGSSQGEASIDIGIGGYFSDGDCLPIVHVEPVYPRRAQSRNIEGYVLMTLTVTPSGTAKDVKVIESQPEGMFDKAAVEAALKNKYKPKIADGRPTTVTGVRHRITFEMER